MNPPGDTIRINIVIHATPEKVWRAWTEPALLLRWFGSDPDGTGIAAKVDLQTGGGYEVTFRNSDGTEYTCYGNYLKIIYPGELSFNWAWKNEPGVQSTVTIILSPENDNTFMQFEHAGVGTASAHNYLEGWTSTFEKLEKLLQG